MQKDKRYIAFACTGNTCRSPMAEGIFNQKAEQKGLKVRAVSFGLAAVKGIKPSQNAVAVCREIGVDISEHRAAFIFDYEIGAFETIYCMSQEHAMILSQSIGYPQDKIEVLDVADPYGGSVEVYRMCREIIETCVDDILRRYEN